jgi:hypothetical protein
MFIPFLTVPLVIQIAVADGVPRWDVTASCRGAAEAAGPGDQGKDRFKSCLASEQKTREKLESEWTTYPPADRIKCIQSIKWFEPTYTELAACLEMARDAKNLKEGVSPSKPMPGAKP